MEEKFIIRKYQINGETIDIYCDDLANEFYVSQKDLSILYSREKSTISRALQKYLNSTTELQKTQQIQQGVASKIYGKNILKFLDAKYETSVGDNLINWFKNECDKSFLPVPKQFEIIRYNRNNLNIDVQFSPSDNPVWLTQEQIAILFGTSKQNISKHIRKILDSKELERNSVVNFWLITADDGKQYSVNYYNLDMILSIGYRVNSKRGIEFRQWANTKLKELLQYGSTSLKKDEPLTWANIQFVVNDVKNVKDKVDELEQKISRFVPKEDVIIEKGEAFEAYEHLGKIIRSAHHQIVLVDPYADELSLYVLQSKDINANAFIIKTNATNINENNIKLFKKKI